MPSPAELYDTWTYKTTQLFPDIKFPKQRSSTKDTYNYLISQNTKFEFMEKAIELNPFNTSHFAWIDFGVCHVVKSQETLDKLYTFSKSSLRDKMLAFPGCWNRKLSDEFIWQIDFRPYWRFCGGFFVGDRESILDFTNCYRTYYKKFLQDKKILVWDVNIWTWMEYNNYFKPEFYESTHDDSMLIIPSHYLKIVACLTTIPPRFSGCIKTIKSLINQVDHIYISVCKNYKRFGEMTIPDFKAEFSNDVKDKITIIESADYGSATKYLGCLKTVPQFTWMFFCDDDQEYHPDLISKMKKSVTSIGVYQNRYNIVKNGSGGIIHGYVGNLFHHSLLKYLYNFDLPECAMFADDQWMSIYCHLNDIKIFPTTIENYSDIYNSLTNGHEHIGDSPLAFSYDRQVLVKELELYFNLTFQSNGSIINL